MKSLQTEIIQPHSLKPSDSEILLSEKYKNKLILDVELDIILTKPKVSFPDIVGHERAKRALQQKIVLPSRFPQLFQERIGQPSRIWLYGPSGTGKKLLLQACASEIDSPFFVLEAKDLFLRGPKIASQLLFYSLFSHCFDRKMKKTFAAAKATTPSIIYLDDILSLLCGTYQTPEEDQIQALRELHVMILSTSQKPWLIDSYIRRKLAYTRIYIPLPDDSSRKELIDKQLNSSGFSPLTSEDQEYLIKETKGFSAAEIKEFVRRACYEPMREAQRSKTFKICGKFSDGVPGYQACDETDPKAKEMSLLEIPLKQLKLRDVSREDFDRVWRQIEPANDELEIWKYEEFTKDFEEW